LYPPHVVKLPSLPYIARLRNGDWDCPAGAIFTSHTPAIVVFAAGCARRIPGIRRQTAAADAISLFFISTSRPLTYRNLRFAAPRFSYLSAPQSRSGASSLVAFTSAPPLNTTVQFRSKTSHWLCSVNSSPDSDKVMVACTRRNTFTTPSLFHLN
jgi:hypothetical protein